MNLLHAHDQVNIKEAAMLLDTDADGVSNLMDTGELVPVSDHPLLFVRTDIYRLAAQQKQRSEAFSAFLEAGEEMGFREEERLH